MRCSRRPLSAASPESATGHGGRLYAWTPLEALPLAGRTLAWSRVARRASAVRPPEPWRPAAPVCASSGATPTARSGRVTSHRQPGRGRGRAGRPLPARGDAIPRGPDRRPPRSDRRARPQRRRASARVHAHRRGQRDDARHARPHAVPARAGALAAARGGGCGTGDLRRVGRDVHAAARRRCAPAAGPREYDGTKAYARCRAPPQVALAEGAHPAPSRQPCGRQRDASRVGGGARLSGTRFRPSAVRSGRCCGQLLRAPTRSSGSQRRRRQPPSGASSSSTGGRGRSTGCDGGRRPDEAAEVARLWSLGSARADGEGRAP